MKVAPHNTASHCELCVCIRPLFPYLKLGRWPDDRRLIVKLLLSLTKTCVRKLRGAPSPSDIFGIDVHIPACPRRLPNISLSTRIDPYVLPTQIMTGVVVETVPYTSEFGLNAADVEEAAEERGVEKAVRMVGSHECVDWTTRRGD